MTVGAGAAEAMFLASLARRAVLGLTLPLLPVFAYAAPVWVGRFDAARPDIPAPWRIEHSTLPFREGQCVTRPGALQRRGHRIAVEGDPARLWNILDWNLDALR